MSNLAKLRRDPDLAKGRWVDYPGLPGVRLKIASSRNPEFEAESRAALRPHQERIDNGEMDPRDQYLLYAEAIARHLLVDWEGVVDDDGKSIEAKFEARRSELAHPEAWELRAFVLGHAGMITKYRVAARETVLGNSQPASNGS